MYPWRGSQRTTPVPQKVQRSAAPQCLNWQRVWGHACCHGRGFLEWPHVFHTTILPHLRSYPGQRGDPCVDGSQGSGALPTGSRTLLSPAILSPSSYSAPPLIAGQGPTAR